MWPQITFLVVALIVLFVSANKHGEQKGEYNFWASLIGIALEIALLYAGGFFNVFK